MTNDPATCVAKQGTLHETVSQVSNHNEEDQPSCLRNKHQKSLDASRRSRRIDFTEGDAAPDPLSTRKSTVAGGHSHDKRH